MKKTLFSLVLMFLCVAMVMTSCGLFKQDDGNKVVEDTQDTPEVKADKETIVGVVSGTKLGDVFADIKEIALPEMEEIETLYGEAISSFENMKAQAQLSISERGDFTGVIANGGAYIFANEELASAIIMAGEQLYAISQSEHGYSVNATPIAMPEMSDEELAAAIDEYMAQIKYYVDIIDGITIPSLTSSLITKNGDWYVLNRDFTRNMIKSYIVGLATAEGETIDAEGLASLDEELAKINVDLGFAVSGDKIRGVKIDAAITTESYIYPDGGEGESAESAEPAVEESIIKINFEALLTADLKGLDRVAAGLVQDENSVSAAIDLNETNVKIDFDYNTEYQTIDASATIGFDAEAVAVNSIAADFAMKSELSNVEATATVNFDNITKANAEVVVIDFDLHNAEDHGTIDAYIKNDAEGNGAIYFRIATDDVTDVEVTGTIDYDNATDVPAEDEFVFTIIENYKVYDDKAWEIYNAFMAYIESNVKKSGNYTIVYYDAELDVTIVTSVSVNGTYEYIYDENGDIIGEQFVVINNLDPMSIYISEGNLQLDEYYDFDVTYVDGEYVFEFSPLAAFYNDVLGAYVEYVTENNDADHYPTIIYYDEANDVTYKIDMAVNGSWEDVYDEDGNWVAQTFIPNLETSGVSTYVIESDNIPYDYDFTLTIVDGEYVFELSPLTVFSNDMLEAYVEYVTENNDANCYPNVSYYDEANDVTYNMSLYVEGHWEYIYDEDGNWGGQIFVPELESSGVSTHVVEGQNIPYNCDFIVTIVDGEFVFTAYTT